MIIHDDFTNLLEIGPQAYEAPDPATAVRRELRAGADIISLCAALPEMCTYHPAEVGEVIGSNHEGHDRLDLAMRVLVGQGVDPFGVAVDVLRRGGCRVLGKLRVNDGHHAHSIPQLASRFWRQHPQWRIGSIEQDPQVEHSLIACPRVGTGTRDYIVKNRGKLLDYAVPEVRAHRLAVVREFMGRYDLDGLTLNFLRGPYCVSFPSKNAPLLTEFVAACRQIVDRCTAGRGPAKGVLGAILPWDIAFCHTMGLEVERWVTEGLLDYVSPSDGYVTDFNMPVDAWVAIASSTRCAVYPTITGCTSYDHDVCLPQEYDPEQPENPDSSRPTPENLRALAHTFYAQGADGVAFFNVYSGIHHGLYPLTDHCLPDRLEGNERRYICMKEPLVFAGQFLQIVLAPGSSQRQAVACRLYEDLKRVDACVRFKARGLAEIGKLEVDVNGRQIPAESLSLIQHTGEGFLYVRFAVNDGFLRQGANEIGFALPGPAGADVIVQEVEIRVEPA